MSAARTVLEIRREAEEVSKMITDALDNDAPGQARSVARDLPSLICGDPDAADATEETAMDSARRLALEADNAVERARSLAGPYVNPYHAAMAAQAWAAVAQTEILQRLADVMLTPMVQRKKPD